MPGILGLKGLFAIDSLSLILFAMVILGIVDQFPTTTNIVIQTLFVVTTLVSTILFLSRRAFGMILLKISMLASIYLLDGAVYFV